MNDLAKEIIKVAEKVGIYVKTLPDGDLWVSGQVEGNDELISRIKASGAELKAYLLPNRCPSCEYVLSESDGERRCINSRCDEFAPMGRPRVGTLILYDGLKDDPDDPDDSQPSTTPRCEVDGCDEAGIAMRRCYPHFKDRNRNDPDDGGAT